MSGYEFSNQRLLPTYLLNDEGRNCLRMILHRLSIEKPELVYAPQIWPIVALILHYIAKPNFVYHLILEMLRQPNYLIQTKSEWIEHCLVLKKMVSFKKLSLTEFENDRKLMLTNWILVFWNLPINYLVCILDRFLIEGSKVFYRAGLTVCLFRNR